MAHDVEGIVFETRKSLALIELVVNAMATAEFTVEDAEMELALVKLGEIAKEANDELRQVPHAALMIEVEASEEAA